MRKEAAKEILEGKNIQALLYKMLMLMQNISIEPKSQDVIVCFGGWHSGSCRSRTTNILSFLAEAALKCDLIFGELSFMELTLG
jgi:hypothetical protein